MIGTRKFIAVIGATIGSAFFVVSIGETAPLSKIPEWQTLPHSVTVVDAPSGFRQVQSSPSLPPVQETLVLYGEKRFGNVVIIPPGGIYYDSSPIAQSVKIGETVLFLGRRATLLSADLRHDVRRNITVRRGDTFQIGNHKITYVRMQRVNGHNIPVILWRTVDGVAIRTHAVTQVRDGQPWPVDATQIRLRFDRLTPDFVHYSYASGTYYASETWKIDGKIVTFRYNSPSADMPGFSVVPIACPIGHHIGLMLYNTRPIVLYINRRYYLFNKLLNLSFISNKKNNLSVTVNGATFSQRGILAFGHARDTDGLVFMGRIASLLHL